MLKHKHLDFLSVKFLDTMTNKYYTSQLLLVRVCCGMWGWGGAGGSGTVQLRYNRSLIGIGRTARSELLAT